MVLPEELMNAETVDAGLAQITEYLDAGGDVDDVNADGETLLYSNIAYAAGDDLRIVKYLIEMGRTWINEGYVRAAGRAKTLHCTKLATGKIRRSAWARFAASSRPGQIST
jgi:hypothetical protein